MCDKFSDEEALTVSETPVLRLFQSWEKSLCPRYYWSKHFFFRHLGYSWYFP